MRCHKVGSGFRKEGEGFLPSFPPPGGGQIEVLFLFGKESLK